jgi:hypothetical protein
VSKPLSTDIASSTLRHFDPEGGFGVALLIVWLSLLLGGFWFLFSDPPVPTLIADSAQMQLSQAR